jgi:hypothetical protein
MTLGLIFTADSLLSLSLFVSIFCFVSLLLYNPQHRLFSTESKNVDLSISSPKRLIHKNTNLFTPLTCLLEDAPFTSLKGQAYPLATPLLTPLTCLLEDAPSSSLQGQAYSLASILSYTWQTFYRNNLAKPGIDYWQWQDQPESKKVCRELLLLLELPKPNKYTKEILETLAINIDPFLAITATKSLNKQSYGKFAHLDAKVKQEMRFAFKQWHNQALHLIGQENLHSIYRVCYGVSWLTIEHILNPIDIIATEQIQSWWQVLGVKKSASYLQVETAYKQLIRTWHPDLNKSPYANEVTSRLNIAYEQYRSLQQKALERSNLKLFNKLQQLIKPIFKR